MENLIDFTNALILICLTNAHVKGQNISIHSALSHTSTASYLVMFWKIEICIIRLEYLNLEIRKPIDTLVA